jgi:hypothetical protein
MEFKPVTQRWEAPNCQPSAAPSSIPITIPLAAESPPTLALAMIAFSKLLWYLRGWSRNHLEYEYANAALKGLRVAGGRYLRAKYSAEGSAPSVGDALPTLIGSDLPTSHSLVMLVMAMSSTNSWRESAVEGSFDSETFAMADLSHTRIKSWELSAAASSSACCSGVFRWMMRHKAPVKAPLFLKKTTQTPGQIYARGIRRLQ